MLFGLAVQLSDSLTVSTVQTAAPHTDGEERCSGDEKMSVHGKKGQSAAVKRDGSDPTRLLLLKAERFKLKGDLA